MGALSGQSRPVLWQIDISHYSEKVRWALDYKEVDHVRRSPFPGMHMAIALTLTGGKAKTFPILQLDGRTIPDSTAAIAALEEYEPDPALYPSDPEERRRALALEDYFDEQLGPHARLLPFHELLSDPDLFAELAAQSVPAPMAKRRGWSAVTPAPTPACAGGPTTPRPRSKPAPGSSPRWTGWRRSC